MCVVCDKSENEKMEQQAKEHIGIVTQVGEDETIRVKIARNQCDGCKLGEICGVSTDDEVVMSVSDFRPKVGETVLVEEVRDLVVKAIWLCLVIPCVAFLFVVIGISSCFSTLIGCLSGLIMLAVYYTGYYLFKGKKESGKVNFKVKKEI